MLCLTSRGHNRGAMSVDHRKARRVLGITFLVSLVVSIVLILNASGDVNPFSHPDNSSRILFSILIGLSFLTSMGSFLGFVSSTVLAWRKEKRETKSLLIENERKELELEKLRLELDKMKREDFQH